MITLACSPCKLICDSIMAPKLAYALLGLLCHLLVGASTISKRLNGRTEESWENYLSDSTKESFFTTIPKPKKEILPIGYAARTEGYAWAGKVREIHGWCLQRISVRRESMSQNYANLIREWFPRARLCVYHSPYSGFINELSIRQFHPVITFTLKF